MTDIKVGASVKAVDFPKSVYLFDGTDQLNVSSTAYISGSPIVSVFFVAPTSGRVLLTVGAAMRDDTGTNRVHISPVVREDDAAGAAVVSADVTRRGVGSTGSAAGHEYRSRTTLVEGLEPGRTYYAHTAHKVSGGATADIGHRDIMVVPTS